MENSEEKKLTADKELAVEKKYDSEKKRSKEKKTGKERKPGKKRKVVIISIICALAVLCLAIVLIFKSCSASMSYDSYDLNKYIKVGEYKGLEVAPYKVSVTQDNIDAKIDSALEAAKTTEKLGVDDVIADGDTVNIDYVGKIDGKKFENGSAKGSDLVIGSNSFIDGFESGLVGKKIGDKVTLNLTFPEDYSTKKLQGKDVVFTVTVNSATREKAPEYNLEFVKNNTNYKTLAEYEAAVKKQLEEEQNTQGLNNQKTTLWSEALDNTKVKKYPDRELNHYIDFNSKQIDDTAESYGVSREELLANYEFGDEDEFAAVNEDSSKLRVKQEMLVEYIADKEGIKYTDKEKEQMISNFEAQGYDEATVEKQTGRTMEDYVHIELLYQKVLDFLLENAKITGKAVAVESTSE